MSVNQSYDAPRESQGANEPTGQQTPSAAQTPLKRRSLMDDWRSFYALVIQKKGALEYLEGIMNLIEEQGDFVRPTNALTELVEFYIQHTAMHGPKSKGPVLSVLRLIRFLNSLQDFSDAYQIEISSVREQHEQQLKADNA